MAAQNSNGRWHFNDNGRNRGPFTDEQLLVLMTDHKKARKDSALLAHQHLTNNRWQQLASIPEAVQIRHHAEHSAVKQAGHRRHTRNRWLMVGAAVLAGSIGLGAMLYIGAASWYVTTDHSSTAQAVCSADLAPQADSEPAAVQPQAEQLQAPFRFTELGVKQQENPVHPDMGFYSVQLQTTNDIARSATEGSLRQLFAFVAQEHPLLLSKRKTGVLVGTDTPGAGNWGIVTRLPINNYELTVNLNEYAIDAESYQFLPAADPAKPTQFVTLPMVNRIDADLRSRRWQVKERKCDFFTAETADWNSQSITLTPESITYTCLLRADSADTVAIVPVLLGRGELGEHVVDLLRSVIGSHEYYQAVNTGKHHRWTWTLPGGLCLDYTRGAQSDDLQISRPPQD